MVLKQDLNSPGVYKPNVLILSTNSSHPNTIINGLIISQKSFQKFIGLWFYQDHQRKENIRIAKKRDKKNYSWVDYRTLNEWKAIQSKSEELNTFVPL